MEFRYFAVVWLKQRLDPPEGLPDEAIAREKDIGQSHGEFAFSPIFNRDSKKDCRYIKCPWRHVASCLLESTQGRQVNGTVEQVLFPRSKKLREKRNHISPGALLLWRPKYRLHMSLVDGIKLIKLPRGRTSRSINILRSLHQFQHLFPTSIMTGHYSSLRFFPTANVIGHYSTLPGRIQYGIRKLYRHVDKLRFSSLFVDRHPFLPFSAS